MLCLCKRQLYLAVPDLVTEGKAVHTLIMLVGVGVTWHDTATAMASSSYSGNKLVSGILAARWGSHGMFQGPGMRALDKHPAVLQHKLKKSTEDIL